MKTSSLAIIALLLALTLTSVSAQVSPPITQRGLLQALREKGSAELLLQQVKDRGVAFQMTNVIERKIRLEGLYLSKKELDDLIKAIRDNWIVAKRIPETNESGYLVPASDPNRDDKCATRVPAEAFRAYLGDSTIWTKSGKSTLPVPNSPYPVIVAGNAGNMPLLSIEKSTEGYLYLAAQIIAADGRFMAKIDRNEFKRNPHTTWYQKRPDRSTLAIYDDHDREVLYVRYMNSHAIKIRGIFTYPNQQRTLMITDTEILGPGGATIQGMCAETGIAFIRF